MTYQSEKPTAFSRFTGERGEVRIVEALTSQETLLGNSKAAGQLQMLGKLAQFDVGEFLIKEDAWTNEIFFILAGKVEVTVTGFKIGERAAGHHIGEMALLDSSQPRSGSAIAIEPTVALEVSEEHFRAVAARHPDIWRQIAKELANRLRQRKKFIRPSNGVPLTFVACASESLEVANSIQAYFENRGMVIELWTDGVFKPSQGTMESLEAKLTSADFSVAILSADDRIKSRGKTQVAPRDNTIFELGLFAGAIGRERSFIAVQNGVDIKIPSDLAGITTLRYSLQSGQRGKPNVQDACAKLESQIAVLGPR